MKKSILASIFAGLFSLSAVAGDNMRIMTLEVNKEDGSPTIIELEQDGNAQVFEFTDAEANDPAIVEARLADLDEDTRTAVFNALNGIHIEGDDIVIDEDIEIDGDGEHQMVFVKKFHHDGDDDQAHHIVIEADGEGHQGVRKTGDKIMFKMDHGGAMQWHQNTGDVSDVIDKLLSHGDLTPAQIDKIQKSLDAKR